MNKLIEYLKGKKTYITAVVIFIIGGLEYSGIKIPEYVYLMLTSFGLTFSRVGSVKA